MMGLNRDPEDLSPDISLVCVTWERVSQLLWPLVFYFMKFRIEAILAPKRVKLYIKLISLSKYLPFFFLLAVKRLEQLLE